MSKPRTVDVQQTLNRDKVLDEAIFLAICALNKIRCGDRITSVVRLEMAVHGIQRTIDKLNKDRDELYKAAINRSNKG